MDCIDELKRNVHEQKIIIVLVFKIIIYTGSHRALKLGIRTLRSYLKLAHEYEPHFLPNTKVSAAKDHSESYLQLRTCWSANVCITLHGGQI